jgi:hypothetical protein
LFSVDCRAMWDVVRAVFTIKHIRLTMKHTPEGHFLRSSTRGRAVFYDEAHGSFANRVLGRKAQSHRDDLYYDEVSSGYEAIGGDPGQE